MKNKLNFIIVILIYILIFIVNAGCKDEIFLKSTGYKPVLVVEGLITNGSDPCLIKLSLTTPVTEKEYSPYENCIVSLYENSDKIEQLTEIEPGVYSVAEDGIKGKMGNYYKLSIVTPDGDEYESPNQQMMESVDIDTLFPKLILQQDVNYPSGLPGYQFYINTKSASSFDNYFLWDLTETYQYTAEYIVVDLINVDNAIPEDFYKYYRCWKTQKIKRIYTGKTSNLSVPRIVNQPLHFVGTDTRRLQERYSIMLKQYSINEDTYYFYKNLEDQLSSENILTTSQPYNIIGNIKNVNEPNETVFGNFTVASVIQKRIFVNRPNEPFYYPKCGVGFDMTELRRRSTPVYLVIAENGMLGGVAEPCINCTFEGGVIEKPDFWIDP